MREKSLLLDNYTGICRLRKRSSKKSQNDQNSFVLLPNFLLLCTEFILWDNLTEYTADFRCRGSTRFKQCVLSWFSMLVYPKHINTSMLTELVLDKKLVFR